METTASATLPLYVQLPAAAVLVLVLIAALRIAPGTNARYIVFACWLRFMLSAFHVYTYRDVLGGLSGNAIGSAVLFLLGLLLLPRRLLLSTGIMSAYAVIGAIVLSAVANSAFADAVDPLLKFGLFIAIALNCYTALRGGNERRFGMAVLLSFTPLLFFQALSLMFGVAKTNAVGQDFPNYIGGYNHEAGFSVALAALFIVAAVSRRIPLFWKICGLSLSISGILLANYRTAIIAMLPLLLFFLLQAVGRLFDRRTRPLVIAVAGAALVASATTYFMASDRFADLRTIAHSEEPLIKHPNDFGPEDIALLSGRSYLWSSYYYRWRDDGDQLQHLVGFGPDSWPKYFETYAHNTFVDFLFEYGIIGTLALVAMLGTGLMLALNARRQRWKLLAAHASFLVLNLATMPMWMVEGLILYGLLWGYTMFYGARTRSVVQPPPQIAKLRPVPL